MDQQTTYIVIGALVALFLVILIAGIVRAGRSRALHKRFGPEYERAVTLSGRRTAERELLGRSKRVGRFEIRPLTEGEREGYDAEWTHTQALFVDDPNGAVTRADTLLGQVMEARGYPTADFDQQSADLSVDHPAVVQNYRAAHTIALRHERGEASTEELRQAMIHFRNLFDDLVSLKRAPQRPEAIA